MSERHHPWCNYYFRPREGCRMCDDFFEKYPFKDGDSPAGLIANHFPDAVVVGAVDHSFGQQETK